MPSPSRQALGLSLALHALGLALAAGVFAMRWVDSKPPKPPPLLVELAAPPAPASPATAKPSGAATHPDVSWSGRQGDGSGRNLRLSELRRAELEYRPTPQGETAAAAGGGSELRPGTEPEVLSGTDAHEVARRLGVRIDTRIQPALQTIWQNISDELEYPETLVKLKFAEPVEVQFEVDRQGRLLDFDRTRTRASNPYLKVVVMRAIRRALAQAAVDLGVDRLRLGTRIEFIITHHPEAQKAEVQAPIAKNWLFLRRTVIRPDFFVQGQSGSASFLLDIGKLIQFFRSEERARARERLETYRQDPEF